MNWLNNLKMRPKLLGAFILVAGLAGLVGWQGIRGLTTVHTAAEELYQKHLIGLNHLQEAAQQSVDLSRCTLHAVLEENPANVERQALDSQRHEAEFFTHFDEYKKTIIKEEVRQKAAALELKFRETRKEQMAVLDLARAQQPKEAKARLPRLRQQEDELEKLLNELVAVKLTLSADAEKLMTQTQADTRTMVTTITGIVVVLAVFVGLGLATMIVKPLQNIEATLDAVAHNDLNSRVDYQANDELGHVAVKLNTTIDHLQKKLVRDQELATNQDTLVKVQSVADSTTNEEDMIRGTLDAVRSTCGFAYGSYWAMDPTQAVLKCAGESGTVDGEFRNATQAARFKEGEGLSGRAWRQREMVFVEDIGTVTDCCRAPLARRLGIKSAFCFPILIDGKVVGTMDFFSKELLLPSAERLAMFRHVGRAVGNRLEKNRRQTETARFSSMVDSSPTNIIFADRDFVIRYMNPASRNQLKKFESFMPVRVDQIVGTNIDVFHRDPGKQRKLLADPKNLPHRVDIQLGSDVLELVASAMFDHKQHHIGTMVTWDVVTEKRAIERQVRENAEREKQQAEELRQRVDVLLQIVNEASEGDLTQVIPVQSDDAIGKMGTGLDKFFADLRVSISSIAGNARTLSASSEELSAVSSQMSANAEETSSQANAVSAASEQVSRNVQVVAAGVEEMSASIREIAKNASDAARVAGTAVRAAESANTTISKLGESSCEIGKVVKVITSIAEQTNLLALNATIEAARAGEAGKGFAVVANEVKELAKETARATEDIGSKIEAIQSDTTAAVTAINQISQVINQINDISSTIASAVEEQTATTNEISRGVGEAAKGSSEIAQNITSVAQAALSTSEGASNALRACEELAHMATELQQLVSRFQYEEGERNSAITRSVAGAKPPISPSSAAGRAKPNGRARTHAGY